MAIVACAGLVVIAGATPIRDALPFDDKMQHGIVWGVFGALLSVYARARWPRSSRTNRAIFAFACAMALGALDELVQSVVPGRDADALDLIADAVGALAGIAAFTLASFADGTQTPSEAAPD
jgi:VanZ family protein